MDGDSADSSGRDWTRIGLVVGCMIAAIAVVLVMPAFAVDGLAGSPLETILPGESADISGGAGSGSGALGALNPGAGTGVGGEIGLNSEAFGSTSTEVHFTVESSKRTYWRTAAYGTYTGSGWERSAETSPVSGKITHPGPDGERIDYEVTLNKRASAVPTAFRPALIEGVDDPQVTDNGAIQSGSTLEAGTTISGVSFAPRDDVDRLRSTSESYPSEIEQRYTQLPDGTAARIGSRTESVFAAAQADGSYEKAVAVQEFLRSSKEYDLSVSERDNSIAETFLFEMDAGYCEYFASTMAVMLRSQDIPARYVVGYSSGQRVAPDTYEVRGMNAHAWVEVYFEGVGWVRFDPTPGNERLETQQNALEQLDGEFDIGETGSPGEQFIPGGSNDEPAEPGDRGLETSLNRTAVPGVPVKLTVTYDTAPVSGVDVLFNGEFVGTTRDGMVTGRVPDAAELTVTLRENAETPETWSNVLFGADDERTRPISPEENETMSWDGTALGRSAAGGSAAGMVATDGQPTVFSTTQTTPEQPEDTHPIRRTAAVVVNGDVVPGGEVLLTARIDDIVIDGAIITVNGEEVGQTNESGQISIELPDRPGDVSIAVERGAVTGQRTITIPELTMSVESGTFGPNAFGSVTVVAELDGERAAGVPVALNGEQVAVTGVNGTAQVSLPFRSEASLAIEASGQRTTETLTGLLYVPIGAGIGLVGVVVSVGYGVWRRGLDWRTIGRQVSVGARTVFASVRQGFVALITNGDHYLGTVGQRLRNGLAVVTGVVTGQKSVGQLWQPFKRRLKTVRARVTGSPSRSENTTEQLTVREAWSRFLDTISANTATTQTPGELARHAIEEDGLPERPVTELRDTFREVEYGHRSASDRLDRVQDAIEQIESAR